MGNPVLNETGLRLRSHTVHLEDRSLLSVTGVRDVGSFNESEVCLTTDTGSLIVEGSGLHITRLDLDSGQVMVEGEIGALVYEEELPERKTGLFSRLFR
jgi:sporulation protein YabP